MTMTTPSRSAGRHERIYRRLLVAYPRDFRDEYGEDLVQGFRDLMAYATDGRGVWWRTTRDLISSAARERGAIFSGGRKPPVSLVFVLLAMAFVAVVSGPGRLLPLILALTVAMVALPVYGVTRFHRAWLVRRTTGGPVIGTMALGVVSFVPAGVLLVVFGGDSGYLVFATVGITLIVGSAMGLVWGLYTLVTSARDRLGTRRWVRPTLVLIPCLAVLGFIIGASYNSYRNSLGPPGDHSVENASADTRALWEAANEGDVDEVVRLTSDTCADPWVKFPDGNGRHNAKGQAETRELEVPDELEPPFREISGILGDYMDVWYDRCRTD